MPSSLQMSAMFCVPTTLTRRTFSRFSSSSAASTAVHAAQCTTASGFTSRMVFCYRFFICDIKLHIRHGGNRSTISDAAVGRSNVTSYAFISTAGQFIHYVMAKLAANTCYEKISCFNLLAVSIHFFVVVLILAGDDGFPPFLVVKVPFDGLFDSVCEFCFRNHPSSLWILVGSIA